MVKWILLYLLLLSCCLTARTQPVQNKFRIIGKTDGLPSLLNFNVCETSDGYFWLATQTGLFRYDGKTFEPFYACFTDTNAITGNIVTDLQEDKRHQLWIGSFSAGMSTYNLETGQWKQYKHPTPDNNPIYRVLDFFYDQQQVLWIGTGGRGLLRFNERNGGFSQFIPDTLLPADGTNGNANTIREITGDPVDKDVLWLAAMDGLYHFNKRSGCFTRYENRKAGTKAWKDNCFHTILADDAAIWLGTWGGGLVKFDKRNKRFTDFPLHREAYQKNNFASNIVSDIFKASDTSLYVAAQDDGLFEFILSSGKYVPVITAETGPVKNVKPHIVKINQTSDGCLWISGMNVLYIRHPTYHRFGTVHTLYRKQAAPPAYRPELQDVLWLPERHCYWLAATSSGGVLEYDSSFRYTRSIGVEGYRTIDFSCNALQRDAGGKIWLQVYKSPVLYYYDPVKGCFRKSGLPSGGIPGLVTDTKKNIWMVDDSALIQYDASRDTVLRFPFIPSEKSGLRLPVFHAVWQPDLNGNIWIGSNIGLWKFDPLSAQWTHFYPSGSAKGNALADPYVTTLAVAGDGHVWVATESQGLQVVDAAKCRFVNSYQVQGNNSFLSPQVNYMQADSSGNIWAATNNGLGVLRKGDDRWEWFDERDGIAKDYMDQPLFALPGNKIIVSQGDGFLAFDANNREQRTTLRRMKLAGLRIDGEHVEDTSFHKSYRVGHDKKSIGFYFTAIEPIQPERLVYLYRLEGYNSDWQTTRTGHVQYNGLPAGDYTFIVKAGVNDGRWSEALRIPIQVMLPFWKKAWFILSAFLLVLLLLYAVHRYRIRQLLALRHMRNEISSNLHDELGSTVSSMNMLATVARKQLDENHPVATLLAQIGQSARQAGESIDEIIWSVQPGHELAVATINRIQSYVSGLFESVDINYDMEITDIPDSLVIDKELAQDIWLVCKEAVNNIIKFSDCSNASFKIGYKNSFLEIYISDDGKGFNLQQARVNGRNGLRNMECRIKKYKTSVFRILTCPGTQIYCSIPVKHGLKM